jgi:hypothetical protein
MRKIPALRERPYGVASLRRFYGMSETVSPRRRWRQRVIALFSQPIKLPGWAAAILAVIVSVPDWHSRIEFWLAVAKNMGGYFGMIAAAIASPFFSPALFIGGLLWVLLVGEPARGVQRRHWLRYVGWSVFLICFTAIIVTAGYGAVEIYIEQEVGKRDHDIQQQAAVRPIFWHMTDLEKTSLAIELDKVPDNERFELKIKCLPDAGSRAFVEEIGKVFIDHHWKISANCLFSNVRPDLVGLYVSIPKNLAGKKMDELPPNLATLLKILSAAEIPGKGVAVDELKDDEFYLVVGNAP